MKTSLFQQLYIICAIIGTPVAIAYVVHNVFGYSWLAGIIAGVTPVSFVWLSAILSICLTGKIISTLSDKTRSLFTPKRN